MSDIQDQSRTEEATPRRRERARQEGQVLFSPDLSAGVMLSLVSVACYVFRGDLLALTTSPLVTTFQYLGMREWGMSETVLAGRWLIGHLFFMSGLVFVLTSGSALLITQLQSGFTITFQPLVPNWEKISPVAGWRKLISLDSLFRGLLAVCKLVTSLVVVVMLIRLAVEEFRVAAATAMEPAHNVVQRLLLRLLLTLSGVSLVWGIADYAMRFLRQEEKLKMSKQEVKDEQKEDQLDPQLKAKQRRLQQQMAARRRTLKEVPQATMVITNPTHYAIALKYQTGVMSAPVVIAKGTDEFALRIADTARRHGVPVLERKPLTRAIFALAEVGDEIPAVYYRAIAELLAHVYRLKGKVA